MIQLNMLFPFVVLLIAVLQTYQFSLVTHLKWGISFNMGIIKKKKMGTRF